MFPSGRVQLGCCSGFVLLHLILITTAEFVDTDECSQKCSWSLVNNTFSCQYGDCTEIPITTIDDASNHHVEKIILSGNSITEVPDMDFQALRLLDLSKNKITALDRTTFFHLKSLESLILSSNAIQDLDHFGWGLDDLRYLYLDHNHISRLRSNFLSLGLDKMLKLYLNNNQIEAIEDTAFADLWNLKMLSLSNNLIRFIQKEMVDGLDELENLELDRNEMIQLYNESFTPLESLRSLNLAFNRIGRIEKDTFKGLKKLRSLDLRNNRITSLNGSLATPDMSTLTTLYLSGNPLTHIEKGELPQDLERITLDNMSRPHLDKNTFRGLKNMKELHISNNPTVTSLPEGIFDEGVAITKVSLSNNGLTTLSKDILPSWDAVKSIDISGNPWRCDCKIKWLRELDLPEENLDVTCASPSHVKGRRLIQLSMEELSYCAQSRFDQHAPLAYSLIAFATFILLTVITIIVYKKRHILLACCYANNAKYSMLYNSPNKDDDDTVSMTPSGVTQNNSIVRSRGPSSAPEPVAV